VTQPETQMKDQSSLQPRPYPRPPELGWYPEDREWLEAQKSAENQQDQSQSVQASRSQPSGQPVQYQSELAHLVQPIRTEPYSPEQSAGDETVIGLHPLRGVAPHPALRLTSRSGARNQSVDITGDTVLGRKPLQQHFPDAVICTLVDPSRTMSREHAMIRFDRMGRAWIEDLGSLNGTSILSGQNETPVEKDRPVLLNPGVSLRLGDEFYQVSALPEQN
jgi:hypothetical protein